MSLSSLGMKFLQDAFLVMHLWNLFVERGEEKNKVLHEQSLSDVKKCCMHVRGWEEKVGLSETSSIRALQ